MIEKFAYTTGTYAVAAANAALSTLLGNNRIIEVQLTLPNGEKALIPVSNVEKTDSFAKCGVVKKSVEEADVTHNMEIFAQVSFRDDEQIVIDGGKGIGRITKKGLQLFIGEAAINPVPRKMIVSSLRESTSKGLDVIISAPKGEEIAATTYNSRLGIIGGISIIGTTGIMKPKSLSSFKHTILQQLNVCKENSAKEVVITPGNISEEAIMARFGDKVQRDQIVQSGDYLGFTLKHAYKMTLSFLLAGHPGKLAKVLTGHFQTHYSKSPPANEAVIRFLKGKVSDDVLKEMKASPTVEGITVILQQHQKGELLNDLAEAIEEKVQKHLKTEQPIPILLFNMNRELIGSSKAGAKWAER